MRNFSLYLLLFVLGILYLTKPEHKTHLASIDTKFCMQNPISCKVGLGKTADLFTDYTDFVFFSLITTKESMGQKEVVSVGILNHVFVKDLDIDS